MKIPLLVLLAATSALAQSALRTWTSTDGRKIEAAFVSATSDAVKIRMANGSTFEVPLARLSAEDQAFIQSQASAVPAAAGEKTSAALREWPRTISLADKPEVVVVREDEEKREFVYRSPHYEFVCDSKLGSNVVREFGRMFEATYELNCQLPLDLKPTPERLREIFQACLFTNKADYMDAGAIEGSAGVYMSGKKALMVPLSSLGVRLVGSRVTLEQNPNAQDNGTLIHEITHQMMNHWLPVLPTWFIEGSAEYVEMLEYNSNGKFSLIGLNRQVKAYADNMGRGNKTFMMIDLEELMTIDGRRWAEALGKDGMATENYGSAGLLTYFFYHLDGKGDAAHMIAFLREVENVKSDAESEAAAKKHLLRERSYEQLADEVKKAFRKEGVTIEFFPPGKNGPKSSTP
ncbi:MAG: SHD1 domain-containing protein [Prosthecobacter sp.]